MVNKKRGEKKDGELVPMDGQVVPIGEDLTPAFFQDAGPKALKMVIEFLTVTIRNKNTRLAYALALRKFGQWCDEKGLHLETIEPTFIAMYIEQLGQADTPPSTVKQSLAAIRMCFDWLVTKQVIPINPAHAVRGPTYTVRRGKTPVRAPEEIRQLLDSIDTRSIVGLRDRAIIATMAYTFARVGALETMKGEDYFQHGKRWWLRLHEKGGKVIEMPVHHNLETDLDAYVHGAGIADDKKGWLFRAVEKNNHKVLTEKPMPRINIWYMVKRRSRAAGIPTDTSCHTFRATGITTYLKNGGSREKAQQMAGHASARTTQLYDRRDEDVSLDEVERITY